MFVSPGAVGDADNCRPAVIDDRDIERTDAVADQANRGSRAAESAADYGDRRALRVIGRRRHDANNLRIAGISRCDRRTHRRLTDVAFAIARSTLRSGLERSQWPDPPGPARAASIPFAR